MYISVYESVLHVLSRYILVEKNVTQLHEMEKVRVTIGRLAGVFSLVQIECTLKNEKLTHVTDTQTCKRDDVNAVATVYH